MMNETKPTDEFFTLVFAGNIRSFEQNPFKTATPFGYPIGAAIGDLLERCADLEEALSRNAGAADAGGTP
jgi:hypothetical protein